MVSCISNGTENAHDLPYVSVGLYVVTNEPYQKISITELKILLCMGPGRYRSHFKSCGVGDMSCGVSFKGVLFLLYEVKIVRFLRYS